MRRYVLTGAPGAGKTSVLGALRDRGLAVVAEAATDVIGDRQADGVAEPWEQDDFIDRVVALQRDRLGAASSARPGRETAPGARPGRAEVHDRSAICTLALARYLGRPVTPLLAAEVARAVSAGTFAQPVFLLQPLGFIEPTAARRISYRDSLEFGRLHEAVYREHGFDIFEVAAAPVAERAAVIAAQIAARA
jgi:predicted ATPase